MNKKTVAVLIVFSVIVMSISGCIDETPTNENKDMIIVGIVGDADYGAIQEAIEHASDNATITVQEGTYYEHLLINKSLTLKGMDAETTIIDGNGTGDVIYITENGKATIQGFTIRNSGTQTDYPTNDAGIEIKSNYNNIRDNIIEYNYVGIYSQKISHNNFTNNIFLSNTGYAMYLYSDSNENTIKDNFYENNTYALRIKGSEDNLVVNNIFQENQHGLYFCCGATNNIAYHNSFINNSMWNAYDYIVGNIWDNGYPDGGNYWDDYNGTDADEDGIGDTPYNLTSDGSKRDNYPLMRPLLAD
jgi:parallel beta-helix repeat protein